MHHQDGAPATEQCSRSGYLPRRSDTGRRSLLAAALVLLGTYTIAAWLPAYAVFTLVPVLPSGDGLTPEDRRAVFYDLLEETLGQMPADRRRGLLMVGMGSWVNVDPQIRARADDIDATVAYPEDQDNHVARTMVGKFQSNLRRWSDATGIKPDVRLFFHDPETDQEEMYRGPTGEYFFFRYSKQNNPNSAFEVGLEEGDLVQRSLPTEAFWERRGKKVPDSLVRAHLFVEDNQRFTRAVVGKERPALRRAVKIAKYVDRVEAFLKDAILAKWGKTLPVQSEAARQMVRVVNCIRGQWLPLDALASVVMESEEETRRVRECLKGMPGEGPGQQTAELYRRADAYFQATREQVRSAQPQRSWWY